jgi:flagellar basal-body rod protein FlgB
MEPLFLTRTDVVVRGAMDGLAARHRAFVNNVANIETPGFQPVDVSFETELRHVRDTLADQPAAIRHLPPQSLEAVADGPVVYRQDGNGVEADRQMIRLTENTLTYEALTQAARMRGEVLRSVITEGKR